MNEMPQPSKLMPEVIIERVIPYPPEQVFKAWTDQEAIRMWMGPGKSCAPNATMDARVGGSYVFPMQAPDGTVTTVRGVIKELVPNRKLRFTWELDGVELGADGPSEVTIEFHKVTNGTRLVLRHAGLIDQTTRDKHARGWSGCTDSLEMYLDGKFFPCG
jgi:uncharacterized protein YndB with AHSA1/START domain